MILDEIVSKKLVRIEQQKKKMPLEKVKEKAIELNGENKENLFEKAMKKEGLSIIGEYKKASPSKGVIVEDFNIEKIYKLYKELNIDAFSVLTEQDYFLGSDDNLKKVRSLSDKPILRKDFVIDFYQIYEAKVLGADTVLLIVSVLGKENTKRFYDECKKFNFEPLVEVHDKEEIEIALEAGAKIIGVNNRNLKTFKTSIDYTKELIDFIPKDKIVISESGIKNINDLENTKAIGCDGVLVGEMFMRNIDNLEFKRQFLNFKR